MKKSANKQLTAALLAGLTLAVAAPAMAAANPFSDVPAKHWAYDSVAKLAAAGIVDGYGDGTFCGDRTMTRYEMAQIVAKAMAHEDKANAEQKAMIEKLAQEFQDELDNLGVRVSILEKKIGNITWTGQARTWYDWIDNDSAADNTNLKTRILLWTNAQITDDMKFVGRFSAESNWGESNANWVGSELDMDNAYLAGKNFTFGRQPITLGKGIIYNIGYNNDGATYTFGNDSSKVKLTVAAFKSKAAQMYVKRAMEETFAPWDQYNTALLQARAQDTSTFPGGYEGSLADYYVYTTADQLGSPNVWAANLTYQASKDLDFTLTYAKSKKQSVSINLQGYIPVGDGTGTAIPEWVSISHEFGAGTALDTWALGVAYKGIKNITVTGEYGVNRSDLAKLLNEGCTGDYDDAKAWVAQIKYKGAQWDKPHTYGIWVGYRDAEPGFLGITGDPLWETADSVQPMNNVKGFEYGFDYTIFKNGVFTFNYMDFENNTDIALLADHGKEELKSMTAQLRYMF